MHKGILTRAMVAPEEGVPANITKSGSGQLYGSDPAIIDIWCTSIVLGMGWPPG